jgi:predicted phage terminase large subunit-like protein
MADDALLPFTRLCVEMPPRHAKSTTVSQNFAAWYLGRHPDHHVILSSYSDHRARFWGRKARDLLETFGKQFFGISISSRSAAGDEWEIEDRAGGMVTAGIGGAITGVGAQLLVIDDAVKNAEEAHSKVIQERNSDWWQAVALTRLEPDEAGRDGIVVVVGTRWHENDLIGSILSNEEALADGEVWYTLKLPALAEQYDPLQRQVGEALWPERWPVERLLRRKARLSGYFWQALYQQQPSPDEGNVFLRSWWQYYDKLPPGQHPGYTIIDTAGYDTKERGDYAVLASVVRVGRDLYWLGVQRGHWTFPELVQRALDARAEYDLPLLIEEVPWAQPLIQTLKTKVAGVIPFKIEGRSKEARADAASPFCEAGNFWLPRRAAWVGDFVEEHAQFPNGAHDDMVDCTSMAALRLLIGAQGSGKAVSYA